MDRYHSSPQWRLDGCLGFARLTPVHEANAAFTHS